MKHSKRCCKLSIKVLDLVVSANFLCFNYTSQCKTCYPRVGAVFSTNMASLGLVGSNKKFFCVLFKLTYIAFVAWLFGPHDHYLNRLGGCLLGDTTY